ncbi:hypothetical protein Tco_0610230 [Tanacetum coccineum]
MIVISEDEDAEEDSSKQGRKIFEIDKDPTISLVHPEQDMEYDFDVSTTEGFTTASVPVTTASASISTVSPPRVSTAEDISGAETLVQERAGFEATIRLQEQFDEEERQRLARQEQEKYDLEKALELQKHLDEREEVVAKVNQDHDIDWSGPALLRYHIVQNSSFSKAEILDLYLKEYGDQNHAFVPKDSKIEKEVMKRPRFNLQHESTQKNEKIESKQVEEEIVQQEDVDKDKRQKMQDDPEKCTLKEYVEVISDLEEVISVIPLAVKSLIMLNDFDREDLIVLYRLLNEKYASTRPVFDDLMLWGDLKIMFEPDSDDEVWKNHQNQELIEWKLYDSYGVHSLMLGEVSIHMLVEKKYPLP